MSQLITRACESHKLVVRIMLLYYKYLSQLTLFLIELIRKGLFGGSLELYPVFNPSLYMPILALTGQTGYFLFLCRALWTRSPAPAPTTVAVWRALPQSGVCTSPFSSIAFRNFARRRCISTRSSTTTRTTRTARRLSSTISTRTRTPRPATL